MDLYDVLDQIVDLLQQRKRLTYRLLKRQFSLDDKTLDDLKDELIYAQRIAFDEDDKVLVWAGGDTTPEPAIPSPKPAPQVAQPTRSDTPPSEPPIPDAERRQLTVMFCDLTDSTRLSGQLDPEDLRDVIRAYQSTSAEVIERYDGYIAQHLGDGLMVYFGWPQAHEDDAQRAVHAGVGMIQDMGDLNTRLEQDKGVRLAVRIGIHTGPVVIGEMGGGGRHEQLALGETINIAARLEGIAVPNTVVVSETTYRLVEGYFACDDLGTHTLKGVETPMRTYRVRQATGVQGRLDVAMTRGLTPFVGRESEVSLLLERWQQVKEGQGQIVLLRGEAGIGKSRLLHVLQEHVADVPSTRLACRSSPYYQHTALYPITDLLQRLLGWRQDNTPAQRLQTLEHLLRPYRLPLADTVPLLAALLSLPLPAERYAPLQLTPQRQRQKTLETLVAMLLEQAERQPLLFILEDLHWTDPTTLEWLTLVIEQAPTASLLVVATCRPEFEPPWCFYSHCAAIALNRFSRAQIEAMVQGITGGKTVDATIIQHLREKTDGVPLYVEEMTKAILESGVLQKTHGHYELPAPLTSLAIPMTLQDSLMARLDRLETSKGIAQLGATLGRQFTYELLKAVSSLDELALWRRLVELVEAELLYQRGSLPQATFTFKHALIQETAYQSILRSTRQQHHQRIAQVLIEQFPHVAETQPELVATHYSKAGLAKQAIPYYLQAGKRASGRSAHAEAIVHLTEGLDLLKILPESPERVQQEMMCELARGVSLGATKGYGAPEVEQTYARARQLCRCLDDATQRIPVLLGLSTFYQFRAALPEALELGEQALKLAQKHEPGFIASAQFRVGSTLCWLGEFARARDHLARGIATYESQPQRSTTVAADIKLQCLLMMVCTAWPLGYPDQSLEHLRDALTMAHDLSDPYNVSVALSFAGFAHQMRGEAKEAFQRAEEAIEYAKQGFPHWLAWGTVVRGWALVKQYQDATGIPEMRQSLEAFCDIGTDLGYRYLCAPLADAYGQVSQFEDGLRMMDEALVNRANTGERFWDAELYRLKGELLRAQSVDNQAEAETCFRQALAVSRSQQAKSLELRAATSLARLWQSQGKRQEAYDLLAPIYGWFTAGFDTTDLQDAKTLLDALT
jgi:class 3 adenylate cyclase/tetratricopeptide (TPR) repeat protein